jgi:hypothetical protein
MARTKNPAPHAARSAADAAATPAPAPVAPAAGDSPAGAVLAAPARSAGCLAPGTRLEAQPCCRGVVWGGSVRRGCLYRG